MKYSEIKVSTPIETTEVSFNETIIKVKKNLTTNELYDLVMITLQEAKEDCFYNPLKVDVFFHVNLIMMITDIEFEAEDRINKFDTYDELKSSGLMFSILDTIPKEYYQYLREVVESVISKKEEFENRTVSLINKIVQDLPAQAEAAAKIVEQFDPEQYQKVIDFATAANGGRPIVDK